ncbi:GNAT family N-acetyltransferase [Streptomyces sp. NPDC056188]|uniref:GNAT family N-acetyltransferase n=1 Tax=Streptomyces sp. NPDC056188 TaxID=3345740 RepID=UPI0035DC242D
MTGWRVRDYSQDDLEAVVRVDAQSGTTEEPPLFPLSDAVTALQALHPAVVATADDVLIGAAVSRVEGDRAWILRICMAPGWRQRGLGSALITALEQRLFADGVAFDGRARPSERWPTSPEGRRCLSSRGRRATSTKRASTQRTRAGLRLVVAQGHRGVAGGAAHPGRQTGRRR